MAEHLFVRLDTDSLETRQCSWIVLDADGRCIVSLQRGSIGEIAEDATGRRTVLLLPAVETITTQAELPTTSQARMRQMVPFSLEDALAEDIDRLAFGIGKRFESGAIAVTVVSRERLEAWLALAEEAGISPSAVCSEADGVPDTPSTLNLIVDGDTCYARRPGQPPLALDGLGLDAAFAAAAATNESEQEVQHAQIFLDEETSKRWHSQIEEIRGNLSSLSLRMVEEGALPGFAAKLVHEPGTNMLQGRYAPRSNWAAMVKPWRVAAGMLAALLVVTLLSHTVEYLNLRQQDRQLTELVTARCNQSYGTSRLSQCEDAVGAVLANSTQSGDGSGENFLTTLAATASMMDPNMEFENLGYRNRAFNLDILSGDVASFEAFSRRMVDTRRFDVNIQNTSPEDGRWKGRVVIMEAGQ